MLFLTSGTSGLTKICCVSRKQILHNVSCAQLLFEKYLIESVYLHLSFAHSGGWLLQAWAAYKLGLKLAISKKFNLSDFKSLLEHEEINTTVLLPSHATLISDSAGNLKKISLILTGSQKITRAHVRDLLTVGKNIVSVFGATEFGPYAFIKNFSKEPDDSELDLGDLQSGFKLKLPPQDFVIDELMISGEGVFEGYIDHTKDYKNDFFLTGDLVFINNGLVYFSGKAGDLFQVGGLTYNPVYVENKILSSKIIEYCCIVQKISPDGKSTPCLVLTPLDTDKKKQLKSWIQHNLTRNEKPWSIVVIGSFPLNPNGKIDRNLIKKLINSAAV